MTLARKHVTHMQTGLPPKVSFGKKPDLVLGKKELIAHLAKIILQIKKNHPVRVAIDGVDASGKTFLAKQLAKELKTEGASVIRASIDGFHNPKNIRYEKGGDSSEGYYLDSFNNKAIIDNVLAPLGPGGSLRYRTAIFDFKTDSEVKSKFKHAKKDSILIMEGIFLLRPELLGHWDLKIFVDANFNVTLKRALKRDGYYLGATEEISEKYKRRYIPGQKMYFKAVDPKNRADIVINNDDFENPFIVRKRASI